MGPSLCDDRVSSESYNLCRKNFSTGDSAQDENALVTACEFGAGYAHEYIYSPYEDVDNAENADFPIVLPNIGRFRTDYLAGRDKCIRGYAYTTQIREQMACLDGYDILAATVIQHADYPIGSGPTVTFDNNYYAAHDYRDVYQDFKDDTVWAYVLVHHVYFPQYYPGFRRDQLYALRQTGEQQPNPPQQSAGFIVVPHYYYPSYYWWNWGYWSHSYQTRSEVIYVPSARPSTTISGGLPPSPPTYGPKADPRPYEPGSPWYSSTPKPAPAVTPNSDGVTPTLRKSMGVAPEEGVSFVDEHGATVRANPSGISRGGFGGFGGESGGHFSSGGHFGGSGGE
jgi:hypothetical protein